MVVVVYYGRENNMIAETLTSGAHQLQDQQGIGGTGRVV
jgi:hypothetical protein